MLSTGLCLAALLGPSVASASHCDGCLEPRPVQVDTAPDQLAADAPLLILLHRSPASGDNAFSPEVWETIDVSVRDDEGVEVTGSRMPQSTASQLWWPDSAWSLGTYTATIRVAPRADCGELVFETSFEVVATGAPPPALEVTAEVITVVPQEHDNFVCCDGGRTHRPSPPGSGCSPDAPPLEWLEGACAPLSDKTFARVVAILPDDLQGHYLLREHSLDLHPESGGSRLQVDVGSPTCLAFELVDARTGDFTTIPWCAEDLPLGDRLLDVEDWINDTCDGPAYACPHEAAEFCDAWPDGEPIDPALPPPPQGFADTDDPMQEQPATSGCTTEHPQSSAVLFLGLVLLRRRRRTR